MSNQNILTSVWMKKFLIIIVIYNKTADQIEPLKYFNKVNSDNFTIFLYDNSPISQENSFKGNKFVYFHDAKNSGIAKAYNTGAEYAEEHGYNWLILFDQDTEIRDNNFLKVVEDSIEAYPTVSLFVPTVDYKNGVMSPKPCKYFRVYDKKLDEGVNLLKNVAIINSGMTISLDTFTRCGGYNEKTYLDLADLQFIERVEKEESTFCIISSHLFQDFSNDETSSKKLFSRFKIYCECLKGYETSFFRHSMLFFSGLLHATSLTRRTRNLKFLIHFFKTILS